MRGRLLGLLCLLMAALAVAGDWSMYMGNHYLTGNNDGIVPAGLAVSWKKTFPWRIYQAVSSDGLVFVAGHSRELVCLSLDSGEERWRCPLPFPVIRMPAVGGAWIFLAAGRQLLCVNKWDGKVVWAQGSQGFSQLASPIVEDGRVYYGSRGSFVARTAATGRLLWESGGVMSYGASPVYSEGRLFLQHRDYSGMQYFMLCLDAKSGRELWRREIPRDANVFTPLVYRGSVYMVSADRVMAFAVADGAPGAVRKLPAAVADSPALAGELLHVPDTQGTLHLLHPDDLRTAVTYSHHRTGGNRIALVGNNLYLTDDTGTLLELDRTNGRVRRRFASGIPATHLRPLIFRGRILLPAGETLFCIGKAAAGRDTMPDRGILRLHFVHDDTGQPLAGTVRILWRSGSRWWEHDALLDSGSTVLSDRDCFPSRMTFEKPGFFFNSRQITDKDRGRVLTIRLKPVRRGSKLVFRNILFNTDSSGLLARSLPVLSGLVRFLKANPGVRVRIEGHTDSTGTPAANMTLSLDRARVVREYLVRHNIARGRLAIAGFGDTKPVADNKTETGRRSNRRTEIIIVDAPAARGTQRGQDGNGRE